MEEKVKKRGWVKNAAIVFLAAMLVLTFFSNTIMNRALPEVVTVYVASGTIDSKVRVSGTVSAKENYDVILEQSRKVLAVPVKVGQEVSVGDVLFTLEPGDSTELEAARDSLHALELQYQKAELSAENNDYSRENRNIELAQAEAERARSTYESYALTDAELSALTKSILAAQNSYDEATLGVKNSSDSSGGTGSTSSSQYTALEDARAAVSQAQNNLDAACLAYGGSYKTLVDQALKEIVTDKGINTGGLSAEDYVGTITRDPQQSPANTLPTEVTYSAPLPFYLEKLVAAKTEGDPLKTAYVKISAAHSALRTANAAYTSAQNSINDAYSGSSYTPGKSYEGKTHQQWLKLQSEAELQLDQLKTRKTNYETALAALNTAEDKLRSLQDALQDAQKNDKLAALDRQELLRQISEARADVEKLSAGDAATEVKAKVNGKVQSLSVSAGHTAAAGNVLATIEVPDLGYTMSASVTNEQARLLHVGDTADINNFYWGNSTTAEITAIRTDPKNPQSGKLLLFDISGDVTAGSTLSFSIGEKNASYDMVVPNSAIRSDTNGKFVLIITAKNSPLGNRYYAARAEVSVVAEDEHFSAVSGILEQGDSVITTATANAPIKSGDMVRLSDNNA